MSGKRRSSACSVEEAVAKAATRLGIEQDELSYRVVDHGNSGFLGIGARDARIEVDALAQTSSEEPAAPERAAEGPPIEEAAGGGGRAAPERVAEAPPIGEAVGVEGRTERDGEEGSQSADAADFAPEPQE